MSSGGFGEIFVSLSDPNYFFDSGLATEDAPPSIGAEGVHAIEDGARFEGGAGFFADDHAAEGFGDRTDFVDGGPSTVTGLAAVFAAGTFVEFEVLGDGGADFAKVFDGIRGLGFAIGADGAEKALGEETANHTGEEEGLDAHVEEAGDAGDGVVGVEGGENEVTGHGGTDGDFAGFEVTNFADHDDIGILAKDGAEAVGEGQTDFAFDIDLGDAWEAIFYGFLDGDDATSDGIDRGEEGVERGAFS